MGEPGVADQLDAGVFAQTTRQLGGIRLGSLQPEFEGSHAAQDQVRLERTRRRAMECLKRPQTVGEVVALGCHDPAQ